MVQRTHEELMEAFAVFDMSIKNPPAKAEFNRRWKELLGKVHSDRPGGSEFLSKQLNISRDIINEWLDAGRPQWPYGKKAEVEKTAREKAQERAARERAEGRAGAEKAREDRAEEELRKTREQGGERNSAGDSAADFEDAKDFFGRQARKIRENNVKLYRRLDRDKRRRGITRLLLGTVLSLMIVILFIYWFILSVNK